jgi:glycosyltransferase involved in cell wall biosynthesis
VISIIIPAKNESQGLQLLIPDIQQLYPQAEVIIVNDGSSDNTSEICKKFSVTEIQHPYSKGNGASIKSGLRAAKGDVIICMDADGQHRAEDIQSLLNKLTQGYDMVVGARNKKGQANIQRSFANRFYNWFASWMVGHKVMDLTSGFRAINAKKFKEFISLLPNKFSYPTTITMSFFRAGYSVGYEPIEVQKRIEGTESHVRIISDGIRFLLIIFKIGTLFSPLKIFAPASLVFFITAITYYLFTYFTDGRFTNMGALLFTTSILIFLMGLISEQITMLMYKDTQSRDQNGK